MPSKPSDNAHKPPDQEHPAHALLSRAHPPETASAIFTSKVLHRPLLLRKSSPPPIAPATPAVPLADARARRRAARTARKQRHRRTTVTEPAPAAASSKSSAAASVSVSRPPRMSARRRRALGLWDIPKEQARWGVYVGLWGLWCGYAREILGLRRYGQTGAVREEGGGEKMEGVEGGEKEEGEVIDGAEFITPQSAGALLASADMHGARVRVVRSRCVERVGVGGIVVRDGRGAFQVITEKDEVKVLPKDGTVFRLEIPRVGRTGEEVEPLAVEIHGERFMVRPADRATKKFKMHYPKDL